MVIKTGFDLTKQAGRSFPSAIHDCQYLLPLRFQIVCQLLYTGWAIVVGSVAANGVVHHVCHTTTMSSTLLKRKLIIYVRIQIYGVKSVLIS